jgi:hypothetical protein
LAFSLSLCRLSGNSSCRTPDPAYVDPFAKIENAPDPALLQQQEDNSQRQALKNIFTTFSTMAIATPVYLYHWRQARKSSR